MKLKEGKKTLPSQIVNQVFLSDGPLAAFSTPIQVAYRSTDIQMSSGYFSAR